jgi:hypothetical protein
LNLLFLWSCYLRLPLMPQATSLVTASTLTGLCRKIHPVMRSREPAAQADLSNCFSITLYKFWMKFSSTFGWFAGQKIIGERFFN